MDLKELSVYLSIFPKTKTAAYVCLTDIRLLYTAIYVLSFISLSNCLCFLSRTVPSCVEPGVHGRNKSQCYLWFTGSRDAL